MSGVEILAVTFIAIMIFLLSIVITAGVQLRQEEKRLRARPRPRYCVVCGSTRCQWSSSLTCYQMREGRVEERRKRNRTW